ncbi:pro-resilin-like [Eriocheir sinensis]|uniref:pro-resilin-like n=1 Tax=Eriocheir sinensis TaxID=95602 RepID=UPI0021C8B908|nr:pro-resilin-like [Eriocheir sinensis]
MNAKLLVFLGLVALAVADSRESYESFESSEAKYNFQWAVDHDPSSNEFGHKEARDGDHTQGSYYVQLPDGRVQQVSYVVDGDDGYIADVKYTGSAESFESDESNESFRYYGSNESK